MSGGLWSCSWKMIQFVPTAVSQQGHFPVCCLTRFLMGSFITQKVLMQTGTSPPVGPCPSVPWVDRVSIPSFGSVSKSCGSDQLIKNFQFQICDVILARYHDDCDALCQVVRYDVTLMYQKAGGTSGSEGASWVGLWSKLTAGSVVLEPAGETGSVRI